MKESLGCISGAGALRLFLGRVASRKTGGIRWGALAALTSWASAFPLLGQTPFYFGNDLSYVNEMEDCGAVFREAGEVMDPFVLMATHGTNLARVRLWNDPYWQRDIEKTVEGLKPQYNDLEDVSRTIRRSREAGMEVMLGFHFSDFWADPGRQVIPRAWMDLAADDDALAEAVYDYVKATLRSLDEQGLMPEIVKLGNEANPGILVTERLDIEPRAGGVFHIEGAGRSWEDEERLGKLWNAGIRAVREVGASASINPKIAMHVADPENLIWFYERMERMGVTDFDIAGFSYYYAWHESSITEVGDRVRAFRERFPQYDPMLVETGYLWDQENIDGLNNIISDPDPNYLPVSKETQRQYMVDLTQEMIDAGATGVVFWEPLWVSTPCRTPWGQGSSHEHVAYVDHRDDNNWHAGGTWMEADYEGLPEARPVALELEFDHREGTTALRFEMSPKDEYQFEQSIDLVDWWTAWARRSEVLLEATLALPRPDEDAGRFGRVWRIGDRN